MRKLATQVPQSVSRLLQTGTVRPPTWYHPVIANPPPTLPPRQTPPRPTPSSSNGGYTDLHPTDLRSSRVPKHPRHLREPKPRPRSIVYPEDRVRRQFFKDFPFEALRPTSLVEGMEVRGESAFNGKQWTSLAQRGAYPTVEDTIAFALTLHEHHALPLSQAYKQATDEFVELRAAHESASLAAEAEARHHGAVFGRDPFERVHMLEEKALATLAPRAAAQTASTSTKYRKLQSGEWSMATLPTAKPAGQFTSGQGYVERWKLPPPAEPVSEGTETQTTAESQMSDIDFVKAMLGTPVSAAPAIEAAVEAEQEVAAVTEEVKA